MNFISDLFLKFPFDFFIIVYIYYFLKKVNSNYGSFSEMFRGLFKFKYLFSCIRYSAIFILIYLVYFQLASVIDVESYESYKYDYFTVNYVFKSILSDLIAWGVLQFLLLFLFFRYKLFAKAVTGISYDEYSTELAKYQWRRLLYNFIFQLIGIVHFILIMYGIEYLVCHFDNYMISNNYYLWSGKSEVFNSPSDLTFKNGVYLSVLITMSLFITLLNLLYKRTMYYFTFIDKLLHIIAILICCLAIISGLYSIINFCNNYSLSSHTINWLKNYFSIGFVSVKITSLILMYTYLKFVYFFIFKGNAYDFFIEIFLPVKIEKYEKKLADFTGVYSNYFDNYFFIQTSFYILNVFIAEYLMSITDLEWYSLILFTLLPIFVDDYLVIHVYFKEFSKMDLTHMVKKNIFNILLFSFSIISLYIGSHYITLTLYIFFSILLTLFYFYNRAKSNKTKSYY